MVMAFEEHSREYDLWYTEHSAIYDSEVKAVEPLTPSGLGLEVGVGSGAFAFRLGIPIGVDPALNMLRIAKRRGIDVLRAVGEGLPFRDRSFDYVLMINTLCFLREPAAALSEAHRVLRGSGQLIVCEVPRDSSWGRLIEEKGMAGHRFYRYAKLRTVAEACHILEEVGFKVVAARGTLSFSPADVERVEEPEKSVRGKGFVCLKAIVDRPK
jgi:ubiquinone/menaquinone biosynthesis C-methylase UbiE